MTTHENAGIWEPPPGWTHATKRHATHECGWDRPEILLGLIRYLDVKG